MMNTAYLSLGSNVGRRADNLKKALKLLKECGINILLISDIFETQAVSKIKQKDFLNLCIKIQTDFSPEKLLNICMLIEKEIGRDRSEKRRAGYEKPRIADLDILLFNQEIIRKKNLTVPHKRMHERMFVLKPLSQIAGEALHPVLKKTIKQLLKQCVDNSIVRLQGKIIKF